MNDGIERCERCQCEAPPRDSDEFFDWEIAGDVGVSDPGAVICPNCMTDRDKLTVVADALAGIEEMQRQHREAQQRQLDEEAAKPGGLVGFAFKSAHLVALALERASEAESSPDRRLSLAEAADRARETADRIGDAMGTRT